MAQQQPRPGPPPGMQPQQQQQSPLSPAHLEVLDSIPHTDVPHTLKMNAIPPNGPPDLAGKTFPVMLCKVHEQMKCDSCGVDFTGVNFIHQFLRFAPVEAIPPPPNVKPQPQRAQMVMALKDQGNAAFKVKKYDVAAQFYSKATDSALSRPPWEPAALGREEAIIMLGNRSASHAYMGNWPAALADAETCIALKRSWMKGHVRKARALMGMERYEEAKQAVVDGLQYEPREEDLNTFMKEIEEKIRETNASLSHTVK
ncbi:hypothetical protein L202_06559 [Cryptococcus amylolentus CBS 6039]|uniref:Translocation protein SEC72 n=2 Tax=Cryptococcus amylolentus TaxID=104669 RepID=A0A1E3HGD6_9TREE|nr:hypothetical protein L202_06559 [Cryptococcus amylolentus CBS 6039]ODN75402.1 hypothetical protein L202_06559 [Cryptococcus amylolentus CBS 6039]ODO03143.1 hypothetical protein I350_05988 [Cryptococcus amylolentus CBS 6273]